MHNVIIGALSDDFVERPVTYGGSFLMMAFVTERTAKQIGDAVDRYWQNAKFPFEIKVCVFDRHRRMVSASPILTVP